MADQIEVFRGIVFEERTSNVLFVKRSGQDSYNPGQFEFPGGKKNDGEDGMDALVREVEEETGLVTKLWNRPPENSEVHVHETTIETGKYQGKLHITHFVLTRLVSGDVRLSSEHDGFIWTPVFETPEFGPITEASGRAFERFQFAWALANTW